MEFCDGVNYVSLESCHNIDFMFGVRVYEVEREHHVSFLGESMFGIDNIARALRECEKGSVTAWQYIEVQVAGRNTPRMDKGEGCGARDDSPCFPLEEAT